MAIKLPGFFKPKETGFVDPYAPQVDKKRVIIAGSLIGAVLLGLLLLLFTILTGNSKDEYMTMIVHHNNLKSLVAESQKRVKSSDLEKINSDANLQLTTQSVTLTEQLQKKFKAKGVNSSFAKKLADTTTASKLTEAELLDKFDITYRKIVRDKIAQLITEAIKMRDDIGGKEFTQTMNNYIKDMKTLDSRLNELSLQ